MTSAGPHSIKPLRISLPGADLLRAFILLASLLVPTLAACGPDYSPNTYASTAVQHANQVDRGTVVGVRKVSVSAQGTTGAVTGAAAGGVAGSQAPGGAVGSAFGVVGGALLGGIVGTASEHAVGDMAAYEYVVRKATNDKDNGQLISVTQNDAKPLALGQNVLVIAGSQARIVADYTVDSNAPAPDALKPEPAKPAEAAQSGAAAKPDAPLGLPTVSGLSGEAASLGSKPDATAQGSKPGAAPSPQP